MARDKNFARKSALINPDSEDRLNGGDAHGVVLASLRAEDDQAPFARTPSPIAISLMGGAYTQNFDSLVNTGTSSATPTDWLFSESGTAANAIYSAGTGSSATGDTYSFGAASSTDRAFGTLLSGSLNAILGATFTNNTGGTVTSLLISYFGEMWRYGTNDSIPDRLDFQISVNATSLTTGTWTDVDALDFTTPNLTGAAGLRDGNAAAFRTAISNTITGLSIASGATFWIRWTDFNKANADDGLAIDDFSLTPTVVHPGALSIDDVSHIEGNAATTVYTFTVTRSGGSDGAVGATWTIGFPGAAGGANAGDLAAGQGLTGTVSFANGETSKTITVNVAGDYFPEDTETFNVVLSVPTGGATISDATGVGTITNDDFPGAISIDDVSHMEGDGGLTAYTFTVSRTGQAAFTTVQWTLSAPGGAGNAGMNDLQFNPTLSGMISFNPGETSRTITVQVQGDHVYEGDESFTVTLSSPSPGATIADGTAIGTIVNDDAAPPFVPDGNETLVNQNTNLDQTGSRAAWIDAGHYVIVWNSHVDTPADSYEVMGRLFNADGTPAGNEFQVNTSIAGNQSFAQVATLAGGGFVVVWRDGATSDIHAQLYTAAGAPSGTELALNVDPLNVQTAPWVAALAGGGFVVSWTHNDGVSDDIRARTFGADGLPVSAEISVNTETGLAQQNSQVSALSNGHFVVVWQDGSGLGGDASATGIKMRVFDAAGTALTAETLVNTATANTQHFPSIAALAGGGYVVVWGDYSASAGDVSGNALRGQIFDAAGTAVGSEFLVNFSTEGYQNRPTVAALPDGGFVVGWWNQTIGFSDNQIRAQTFDALGNRRGGEFEVNSETAGDQLGPAFAVSANGQLVATWTDLNDSEEITDGEIEQRLFTLPAPGALSIADLSQAEGDLGPSSFTFTVTRTGGSLGAVGATWTLTLSGDADAADFTAVPQTGTISFADGETSQTITILVQGDPDFEPDEGFDVVLSAPTGGATIADDSGHGTIANDDPATAPTVDLDGGAGGIDYDGSFTEGSATGIGVSIQVTQGTFPITSATVTLTDGLAGDSLNIVGTLPAGITNISSSDQQIQLVGINMSAAEWAAALGQIAFTSSSDNPDNYGTDTARTITVEVSDGFTVSATATATIAIDAVNDAPTVGALDGDSVTWTEGDPYVLLDQDMPATIADPDNQNFAGGFVSFGVQVNPSAEDEFFVLDIFPGVGTIGNDVYVDGANIGTITSSGAGQILTISFNAEATAERVATLLDYIGYRNAAGDDPTAGARSVTYLLNDGSGGASGGAVTVNVVAVNDAPVVADTNIAIAEDQIWVLSLADFDIVDPEGDAIASITVTGVTAGLIYYDADGAGAGEPVAITLYPHTFSFGDIAAGRLSWVPEAGVSGNDSSYFQYAATDDQGAASAGARVYFDIAAVVDGPTVDLNGPDEAGTSFGAAYSEDGPGAAIADTDVAITSESGVLTGATIRITDPFAGDLLSVAGTLPGLIAASYDPGTATLTLSGQGTVEQYQAALTQIRYSSTSDDPAGADTQRAIEIVVTDGVAEGAPSSTPAFAYVTVASVNDAPVVTTTPGTTAYAESVNTAPGSIAVNNALTLTDPDDGGLVGAMVSITGNYQLGQDVLAFANDNSATFGNISAFFNVGTGVLTLTSPGASATLAQWQAALRAVTYSNSSEEPSQATRTISFVAYDGEAYSAAATRLLSVTAQNDSPSGADATRTIDEDSTFTFTNAHFGFSDVDGDSLLGVRFGAAPVGGTLYFDADGAGGNAPVAITSFPTTTISASDIALGRLTFVPTANLNGTGAASVGFTVVDNGGTTGAGQNADLTPNTLTFNITSVNDAPSGADSLITIAEDGSRILNVADFGFSDPDGNAFEAVIFSNVTGGTLYINGNPYTNVTLVYLHTIQSGNVVFVPTANATGATGSITFTVRDDGGFDNGGQAADTTPNTLTFSMTPVNDAPVNAVPGPQTVNEDVAHVFSSANGNALSVTDVDATILNVTLVVDHGTLTLASIAGLTFSGGSDGTADASMTFSGTAAAINAALGAGLSYAPAANYNGGDTLSMNTSDSGQSGAGGTLTDFDTVAITINPVNDAPDGTGKTVIVTEDTPKTLSAADFPFTDVEGNGLFSVTIVTLPGAGILYYDADGPGGAGLPVAVAAGTTFTAAQLGGARLSYVPGANGNGTGYASFTYTVRDNGGTANGGQDTDASPATIVFNVTPANDSPSWTGLDGDSAAYDEDMPAGAVWLDVGRDALVTDIDSADFAGGSLTVAIIGNKQAGEDQLVLDTASNGVTMVGSEIFVDSISVGTISADGVGLDRVISFNGGATAALVSRLIQNFSYFNTNQATPSTAQRLVEFRLADGDGATIFAHTTVSVTAIDDAPVIANFNNDDVTFIEGSAAIRVDMGGDALVTDVDSMDFAGGSLQVLLEEAVPGEDVIGFATGAETGITLSNGTNTGSIVSIDGTAIGTIVAGSPTANSFTVNFNANADAADVTALLRAITYLNTNDDHPSTLTRAIVVFVNDGDGSGPVSAFSNVHVTRVNDAPVNSVPGTQNINEDASLTLSTANGNALSVADVDATILTVTLSVAHGTLTLASTAGLSFSGGSDGAADASMTFSGTAAAVNAALGAGLTYNPTANYNGPDAISVTTTDGGQTGTGPVGTDNDTIDITINPVNDAPAGADAAFTINEDSTFTFAEAHFGFTDAVEGDDFLGVVIATLPSAGTLLYDGAAVTAGQFVSLHDIALGRLTFAPAADANGAPYGGFTFQVRDDGGTGNGGQDTDQSPNTVTFNVTAVNDTPTNSVPGGQTINEDSSLTLSTGNGNAISVADVDATTLTVTLSVAHGTLTIASTLGLSFSGGSDGTADASMTFSGTAAAINAALGAGLTYNPNADFNGSDAISVVTTDGGQTGTGPVGTDSDSIAIGITAINDAPVVIGDGTESAAFGLVEDMPGPGQTINSLFAGQYSDAADNQIPNGGASSPGQFSGIAVTANGSSAATGQWQYFSGGVWTDIGTVSDSMAKLLGDPFVTLIRFNPAPNFYGTAPTLTVHLIDNSLPFGIVNGQVVDISGPGATGGTTAYSTGTVVLSQNVLPINDAPVNTVPGAQTINEDASFTLSTGNGNAISVADVDATTLTVTLTVAHGTLTIASTLGLTFSGGSDGTADVTMTFSGTAAAINAALGSGLTYNPTANYNGPDAISVVTTDNGQLGMGPVGTDTDTVNITINSVNDAPSGANNTLTGSEDDPLVLTAADFGFTDPIDGNAFLAVIIDTFPANGTLFLDSDGPGGAAPVDLSTLGPGVFVSVTDINLGHLYFQPDTDEYGAGYANFTFRVQDDGGMLNGGVDRDPTANTITINIEPDNLPPVVDLDGVAPGVNYTTTFVEDGAAVAIGSGVLVSDPDSGLGDQIESATITLTDRVAGDSLTLTGAVPPGLVASTSNLAGSITITITGPGTGAQYQALIESILYATTSQDPTVGGTDLARTITVTVNDGTISSAVATTTVNITAIDDLPIAQPDAFVITESGTIVAGNLFADNGSGADSDPDGPPLSISAVNGSAAAVNNTISLGSGALLTVNSNGTFNYDPNGAFLPTPTGGSGASNTPGHDGFTYTLAGGNTVTVNITLTGLDTDDTLFGTSGTDLLAGGNGNDSYRVENSSDLVFESVGGGYDGVYVAMNVASYALAAGSEVEILSAIDPASTGDMNLTGNEFGNTIIGSAGVNTLIGGGGNDVLAGGLGNDFYRVDDAGDYVLENVGGGFDAVYVALALGNYTLNAGAQIELLSAIDPASSAAFDLTGNEYSQTIIGTAGVNTLIGGGGDDILAGGAGNDFYRVEDAGDVVLEFNGGGFDSVYATGNYTLQAGYEIELLSAIDNGSTAAVNLTGNERGQYIMGTAGANILTGGGGADALFGFGGNDTYYVDSSGSFVFEDVGGGNDSVYSSTSFALGVGQEIEFLSASNFSATTPINLTGNEFANTIYGNDGANILDGKGGNDSLIGLGGADKFAFTTALGANNVDLVFGFEQGVDKILLDDAIFSGIGTGGGAFNANAFYTGTGAHDLDDRIIYNSATGQLFYDADGNLGGAAILFATLSPGLSLTASDFQVI